MEQSNIEKDKDIERLNQNIAIKDKDIEQLGKMVNNLTKDFAKTQNTISQVVCNGEYVWRIKEFMESLKLMRDKTLQTKYYTHGFYTSSTGYK